MKNPIVFVAWLAGLGVPIALAQTYVPASITQAPGGTHGQVKVTWPTTPGRTYEPVTTPVLNQPWGTNIAPIQAHSTVGQLVQDMDQQSLFYRIRERPVSLGSTGGVTTAMIASVERIAGLAFTTAQRNQMLSVLNGSDFMGPGAYSTMRQWRLLNSDPPALAFNPLPLGFVRETNQNPILWSPPAHATVPTNRAELAYYSVRDLGALLHSGQVTSLELTKLCLDRLKRYDSNLFCVVTLTEELALRQAAQADAELAQGHYRGPLQGIPCGIKDLFATRGYRTTWGATPYSDQVLDPDAEVVRRLNAAGAVLVAKLSLGSLAMGDVWFGGTTRNPWNLAEGSSGSSAGPAAATAAGLVPFAIGTETFGSIVSPCTVCRVTGLRFTFMDDDTLAATNFTGQPCAVVPNGDETGLCFVGKPLDEATVLRVAKAYQDATPFHRNHPTLFPP